MIENPNSCAAHKTLRYTRLQLRPGLPPRAILLEDPLNLLRLHRNPVLHDLKPPILSLPQLLEMHRIGPVDNPDGPDVRPETRQRRVLTDPFAAVRLHRAIDHRQRHVRRQDLGLRDLGERGLGALLVDLRRGVEHDQTRRVDLEAGQGDLLDDAALLGDQFAERFLSGVVGAREHPLEREFGGADRAHRVMDPTRSHSALHHLEPATVAEDDVRGRDADVLED